MLEKVLIYIHNWFERTVAVGGWEVKDGQLDLPHLKDGQYYRIVGSIFNDGLHQHPANDLVDEDFKGAVIGLAIPKSLLELVSEIEEWEASYGKTADAPYSSESFENYSYSKGSASLSSNPDDITNGWQRQFRSRLIPYRKLG